MADIEAGLPVRSHDSPNEFVVVEVADRDTPTQKLRVDADNRAHTRAQLQVGQADVSNTNPVPVSIEESAGDEVFEYLLSGTLAKNATENLEYTVTSAKTFLGKKIVFSASGYAKATLKLETAAASGVYNDKMEIFNSVAQPTVEIDLASVFKQVADAKIRIEVENKDNQSQSISVTLIGIEN